MASYFQFDDADDLKLLHSSIRTSAELENVASSAEADVIATYRFRISGGSWRLRNQILNSEGSPYLYPNEDFVVYLDGYRPDADDALTSTLLKDALKRAIANVISHRLRSYNSQGKVKREKRGRREVEFQSASDNDWPDNWSSSLAEFDLRPKHSF